MTNQSLDLVALGTFILGWSHASRDDPTSVTMSFKAPDHK
jgi:hypothetical protein